MQTRIREWEYQNYRRFCFQKYYLQKSAVRWARCALRQINLLVFAAWLLVKTAFAIFWFLFIGQRIVRNIEPNRQPLEKYEFEYYQGGSLWK